MPTSTTKPNEFEIIKQYFTDISPNNSKVTISTGDDCAAIKPTAGYELLISTDSLIENVHFPANCDSYYLATRALACAASDLAAMAADPIGFTLSLSMPNYSAKWLAKFSQGLSSAAHQFNMQLIGGDLTRGPLNLCFTVFGEVPQTKTITRKGAKNGDLLCVGSYLGLSAAALPFILRNQTSKLDTFYWQPNPQFKLGKWLRGRATAMLDISDGLCADCMHLLHKSNVGADIHLDKIKLHPKLLKYYECKQALKFALTGGDDYLLLFSLPAQFAQQLTEQFPETAIIGQINANIGQLRLLDDENNEIDYLPTAGFQHF